MTNETRQKEWLIEKCTPSDEHGRYSFKGASPHTVKAVMLKF